LVHMNAAPEQRKGGAGKCESIRPETSSRRSLIAAQEWNSFNANAMPIAAGHAGEGTSKHPLRIAARRPFSENADP
jgi:hypothetical protein